MNRSEIITIKNNDYNHAKRFSFFQFFCYLIFMGSKMPFEWDYDHVEFNFISKAVNKKHEQK